MTQSTPYNPKVLTEAEFRKWGRIVEGGKEESHLPACLEFTKKGLLDMYESDFTPGHGMLVGVSE